MSLAERVMHGLNWAQRTEDRIRERYGERAQGWWIAGNLAGLYCVVALLDDAFTRVGILGGWRICGALVTLYCVAALLNYAYGRVSKIWGGR